MRGNVIPYIEMCQKEGTSLQRGMNFRLKGHHSVILMSIRPNSPYHDEVQENGAVLIYEGYDEPKCKGKGISDPKSLDQPEWLPGGTLTENGKFHQAAQQFKAGKKSPDIVQVYEKIKAGIWTDNGFFRLVDSWVENDGKRNVFKFKLVPVETVSDESAAEENSNRRVERSRIIPTSIKLEVWARDGGKCVTCGATDELHFDHVLPFSKGGTSLKAENVPRVQTDAAVAAPLNSNVRPLGKLMEDLWKRF
ncbi:hypothetical protein AGMMS50225_13440 [Betaproteobacteria bacterium]|nr:hypothetical protein AGMMS50225_13440 [Betaproteobacteria bacterium]